MNQKFSYHQNLIAVLFYKTINLVKNSEQPNESKLMLGFLYLYMAVKKYSMIFLHSFLLYVFKDFFGSKQLLFFDPGTSSEERWGSKCF